MLHRSNLFQQISLSVQSANQFSSFFSDKINTLRWNLPLINVNLYSVPNKLPPKFSLFKQATFDEIKQLILSSPKSTCQSDPIPSNLLPHCFDNIVLIITRIVNLSLNYGSFPKVFKSAFVKPLFKKSNLDSNDLKNYRPILNLLFLSKFTEHIIANRLLSHLSSHNLMPNFQFAYWKFHFCETALLCVQNDIFVSLDACSTALPLPDLSAAFDTIDHCIFLNRLKNWFGVFMYCP